MYNTIDVAINRHQSPKTYSQAFPRYRNCLIIHRNCLIHIFKIFVPWEKKKTFVWFSPSYQQYFSNLYTIVKYMKEKFILCLFWGCVSFQGQKYWWKHHLNTHFIVSHLQSCFGSPQSLEFIHPSENTLFWS